MDQRIFVCVGARVEEHKFLVEGLPSIDIGVKSCFVSFNFDTPVDLEAIQVDPNMANEPIVFWLRRNAVWRYYSEFHKYSGSGLEIGTRRVLPSCSPVVNLSVYVVTDEAEYPFLEETTFCVTVWVKKQR